MGRTGHTDIQSGAQSSAAIFEQARQAIAGGQMTRAIGMLRSLLKNHPGDTNVEYQLGSALVRIEERRESERILKRVLRREPNHVWAMHDLALVYKREGRLTDAMRLLDKSLQRNSEFEAAVATKAVLLSEEGRVAEAAELLRPYVKRDRQVAGIVVAFARMCHRVDAIDEGIDAVERALQRPDLQKIERTNLLFALASLWEKKKEYDRAFEMYNEANRSKSAHFDADGLEKAVTFMQRAWSKQNVSRMPRARSNDQRPVLIVGLPRSGTTLVEQVLSSHPEVFGAGELLTLGEIVYDLTSGFSTSGVPLLTDPATLSEIDVDRLSKRYLDELKRLGGRSSRVTDKMPGSGLHLGLIQAIAPAARVVWCRRNPLDTCLSCYFHHFGGVHGWAYDLENLGHYHTQFERLMMHWRQVLDIPILEVTYESLVESFETGARRLVEFVDLAWHDDCLRFFQSNRIARTASNEQVRKPIYTSSIGRHRQYDRHLGPLRRGLGMDS